MKWVPTDTYLVIESDPRRFVIGKSPTDHRWYLTDLASNTPPNAPRSFETEDMAKDYAERLGDRTFVIEASSKEKHRLREEGFAVVPAFMTVADLAELCEETGQDPARVQLYGKYHPPTDNQGGIALSGKPRS